MPGMMCVPCVLQVSRAYTFRQKCRRSDETLQSLLVASKISTEKEIPISEGNECDDVDDGLLIATDMIPVTIEVGENESTEIQPSMDSQQVTLVNEKIDSFDELSVKDKSIEVEPSVLNAITAEMKTPEFHIMYECSMCSSAFSSDDDLQTHIKSVHDMTVISGDQHSDDVVQSTNDINENVTRHKFECPECHKCFSENKIL